MIHPNIGFDGGASDRQLASFWGPECWSCDGGAYGDAEDCCDACRPHVDLREYADGIRTSLQFARCCGRPARLDVLLAELRDRAVEIVEDADYPLRLRWLHTINTLRRQVRAAMAEGR